jgi:hypothetical protein
MTKRGVAENFRNFEVDDKNLRGINSNINDIVRVSLIECFHDFSRGNWYYLPEVEFSWWVEETGGPLQGFNPIEIKFGPKEFSRCVMHYLKNEAAKNGEIHQEDAKIVCSFLSLFKDAISSLERHVAKIPRVPED